MGMKSFKTAGGYRGKETKMKCVYTMLRMCAHSGSRKGEKYKGRVEEGNISNA